MYLPNLGPPTFGSDLFLPPCLDQFQYSKLLFGDVGERDGQPDALCVKEAEAPPHERAVLRVHRLFEPVLRTAGPMADIDRLPIRTTRWAAIQLRLGGIAAVPAPEDTVGTILLTAT